MADDSDNMGIDDNEQIDLNDKEFEKVGNQIIRRKKNYNNDQFLERRRIFGLR